MSCSGQGRSPSDTGRIWPLLAHRDHGREWRAVIAHWGIIIAMFPRTGLWAHADFMRLWSAQAISAFGSRITRTALPIIAVQSLHESETVVAVLSSVYAGRRIV